jgi:hypothetical protein
MGELVVRKLGVELPAVVMRAGDRASKRFLEFFTVSIRNRNTRAAYSHAAAVFLNWCEKLNFLAFTHTAKSSTTFRHLQHICTRLLLALDEPSDERQQVFQVS